MKDKEKIEVGDIVMCRTEAQDDWYVFPINSLDELEGYIDIKKAGITSEKHNEIIERDYVLREEHNKTLEEQRNCYMDEFTRQLADYDKLIENLTNQIYKLEKEESESIPISEIESILKTEHGCGFIESHGGTCNRIPREEVETLINSRRKIE